MLKHLFTYSLTLLLLFSITVPTFISLSDYDVCETSILLDLEEDSDTKENSEEIEEIKELKILSLPIADLNTFKPNLANRIKVYNNSIYQTIYHSLESPPPEFI